VRIAFFSKFLADAQRMKLNQKITNLTTFPIFGEAARGALTSLVMFFETHSYLLNQPLYREGDDATDIYFIMEGEFKLVKNVKIPKEINWNADPIVENFLRKNNDMRKTDVDHTQRLYLLLDCSLWERRNNWY